MPCGIEQHRTHRSHPSADAPTGLCKATATYSERRSLVLTESTDLRRDSAADEDSRKLDVVQTAGSVAESMLVRTPLLCMSGIAGHRRRLSRHQLEEACFSQHEATTDTLVVDALLRFCVRCCSDTNSWSVGSLEG